MKLGMLIPEFPGQTHGFFWREARALGDMGLSVQFLSTRLPEAGGSTHAWAKDAREKAVYLMPVGVRGGVGAVLEILRSGPAGWWRCVKIIAGAGEAGWWKRWRMLPSVMLGARLGRVARRLGLSHIHVHSCARSAEVAMFARLLSGISYSLTLHGDISAYGPHQRKKWSHAAFAIMITGHLAAEMQGRLGDAFPKVFAVAPMGVDHERFAPAEAESPDESGEIPGIDRPLKLFSCGRLNPGKGFADLLSAAAMLRERRIQVQVRIAGDTDSRSSGYRKELLDLAERLKVGHCVQFLGSISDTEMVRELRGCDFFVLASRGEALGVATMEAMSTARPVIVTDFPGVRELVVHGENGWLVAANSPKEIAETVMGLLREPERVREVAERGRKTIVERFSHRRSAEAIVDCLKQVKGRDFCVAAAEERECSDSEAAVDRARVMKCSAEAGGGESAMQSVVGSQGG